VLGVDGITRLDSVCRRPLSWISSGIAIALTQYEEKITMPNEADGSNTPEPQNDSAEARKKLHERLNRIANKTAKQGEEEEERYDEDHSIFTK
jgi:hypothetical protein